MFSIEDGTLLVRFARENIENYLKQNRRILIPDSIKNKFSDKYGAFVTLNRINVDGNPLRGCIGYIEPTYPLYEVVHRVSVSSATEDPRFSSVLIEEMDEITIEISILTPPKLIKVDNPDEYLEKIKIGRDGLIAEQGFYKGLLLPQVPVEQNWGKEEFLSHTCMKAGLLPDAWADKNTKIYKFTGQIFTEIEPRGKIVEKNLDGSNN